MKKPLHIIMIIAGIMMAISSSARTDLRNGQSDINRLADLKKTFVIEGSVDPLILDSCYNIYIADIGETITEDNLVACVPVINKQFTFTTTIDSMKKGRLRAIFPGNELCSAWIDIYFIPGLTVFMTVHNGYYDIHNQKQYYFMVNAWENEIPLSTLFANAGASESNSNRYELEEVYSMISLYKTMIQEYEDQIAKTKSSVHYMGTKQTQKQIQYYTQRIEVLNSKMEKIIEEYSSKLLKDRSK